MIQCTMPEGNMFVHLLLTVCVFRVTDYHVLSIFAVMTEGNIASVLGIHYQSDTSTIQSSKVVLPTCSKVVLLTLIHSFDKMYIPLEFHYYISYTSSFRDTIKKRSGRPCFHIFAPVHCLRMSCCLKI